MDFFLRDYLSYASLIDDVDWKDLCGFGSAPPIADAYWRSSGRPTAACKVVDRTKAGDYDTHTKFAQLALDELLRWRDQAVRSLNHGRSRGRAVRSV